MASKFISEITRILLCGEYKPVFFFSALAAVLFGMWLLIPNDTFGTSPTYMVMAMIASDEVWGLAFLLSGIAAIFSIVYSSVYVQRWFAILILALWTFISASFFVSNPYATGGITYFIRAVSTFWVVFRIWRYGDGMRNGR